MEEQKTDGTKLGAIQREFTAWRELAMTRPWYTFGLGLGVVILIGLGSIAPRATNDLYSKAFPPTPSNPFSTKQITYSNFIPQASDIIDLDHAGTLTPSPLNYPYFTLSATNTCGGSGSPLPYSQGIVLILNVAPTFSSSNGDTSKPIRGISFRPDTVPASNYFSFEAGTTHKISTNGRTFNVTLSQINDLSTKKNGAYFSYVFDINEQ